MEIKEEKPKVNLNTLFDQEKSSKNSSKSKSKSKLRGKVQIKKSELEDEIKENESLEARL